MTTNDEIKQRYWKYLGTEPKPDINGLLERMLNEARADQKQKDIQKVEEYKESVIDEYKEHGEEPDELQLTDCNEIIAKLKEA
jgi:hypothetical protein